MKRFALSLALVWSATVHATPEGTHPFSVHDMVAMDRISDPQVSPDGTWIAFVLRTTDLEANRGRTDLWLARTDGTALRRLTSHDAGDSSPRFSRDGKSIWFLSTRSGSSQVWRIPTDGGEAQKVTEVPFDVENLVVSPDGERIAFTMEVFPDCDDVTCTKKRLDDVAAGKATGRTYDRLLVRHWDTWKDGRRAHLFVMRSAGGDVVDVTKGMDADVPSRPFGGPEEISFTPDGRSLVFTAKVVGTTEAWSTDFDLWLVAADGSSPPKCLTEPNQAWDTQPVFSPDGRTLAYLAMSRPGYEADRFRIVLRGWPDGPSRVLTETWDRSPQSIAWSRDGKTIYAVAEHLGNTPLFAVNVSSGEPKVVVPEGNVGDPRMAGDRIRIALSSCVSCSTSEYVRDGAICQLASPRPLGAYSPPGAR